VLPPLLVRSRVSLGKLGDNSLGLNSGQFARRFLAEQPDAFSL
jgi:hypothetical protein